MRRGLARLVVGLALTAGLTVGASTAAHAAPVKSTGTAGLVKPAGFLSHDAAMKVAIRKANHQIRQNGAGCCSYYANNILTQQYAGTYGELVGLYYECSRWFADHCGSLRSYYQPGIRYEDLYGASFPRACTWWSMLVDVLDPIRGQYMGLRVEVAGASVYPAHNGISGSQVTMEQLGSQPRGSGTYVNPQSGC